MIGNPFGNQRIVFLKSVCVCVCVSVLGGGGLIGDSGGGLLLQKRNPVKSPLSQSFVLRTNLFIVFKDEVFVECIKFLDAAEANGRNLKAYHEGPLLTDEDKNDPMRDGRNTITFEARYLKWLFYELRDGFNYNICSL